MLLCSHHENSSLSTAVYKQSCFAFMEKQFVAEEPRQRLVPNRAEAISQGTGVRIIKATSPLGINCCPWWHTEKRDAGLSGAQRPASPLCPQGSPSASSIAEARRKPQTWHPSGMWWMDLAPRQPSSPAWAAFTGGEERNCLLHEASSLTSPFLSVFILTVPLLPSFLLCFFPCILPCYIIIAKSKKCFTLYCLSLLTALEQQNVTKKNIVPQKAAKHRHVTCRNGKLPCKTRGSAHFSLIHLNHWRWDHLSHLSPRLRTFLHLCGPSSHVSQLHTTTSTEISGKLVINGTSCPQTVVVVSTTHAVRAPGRRATPQSCRVVVVTSPH